MLEKIYRNNIMSPEEYRKYKANKQRKGRKKKKK